MLRFHGFASELAAKTNLPCHLEEAQILSVLLPFICVPFILCVCQCVITKHMTIFSLHRKLPEDGDCLDFIFISLAHSRGLNVNNILSRKIGSVKSDLIYVSCIWTRLILQDIIHPWAILQMYFIHFLTSGKPNYIIRYHIISVFFFHCIGDSIEFIANERIDISPTNSSEITEG